MFTGTKRPGRIARTALAGIATVPALLAIAASPAQAATGDGIDFNNKNTLVQFHTKDCKAEGVWNYLDSSNDFSTATRLKSGPSWCRVMIRVMYKKASTGKKVDTGWQWDAKNVEWLDRGTRCYVSFAIQRPADGQYEVKLTNKGAGGAGCGIDGY